MIGFANAKINIGLRVVGKRSDGYHLLDTVFYPIAWQDSLEILPAAQLQLDIEGQQIPGAMEENLCVKAYRLLARDFDIPPVSIYLHKHVPLGAGLGGGSSNAIQTLRLLNALFDLQLTETSLFTYALQLGADCPFFLKNQPCYGTGIGEILQPIPLSLTGYHLVVLKPNVSVSTAQAFAHIKPQEINATSQTIVQKPVEEWKDWVKNDFEEGIFYQFPAIAAAKDLLYTKGAIFALMSGTGASVYGIFQHAPDLESWHWPFDAYTQAL
jgi:4-diphosphocytidyl-2-C-methyl-D-erythritol kinase